MKRAVSITLLTTFLLGCANNDPLPPVAYVHYMEDRSHDMHRTVQYGNVDYHIQLATPEYVVSKELAEEQPSEEALLQRLEQLKGYTFFYLTIEAKGNSRMNDPALAEQRALYYTQAAAADISLLNGEEELKPITYHFENNYGLAPYNKLLVAFKTEDRKEGEWQLVFHDRFNQNDLIKSTFSIKDIAQLPKLAIK